MFCIVSTVTVDQKIIFSIFSAMKSETKHILSLIERINSIPSVVGYEQYFLSWLHTQCKDHSSDISLWRGYLSVTVWSWSNIFSAHIDRHGMVKTLDSTYQYAANYWKSLQKNIAYEQDTKGLQLACTRMIDQPVVAYNPFSGEILWEDIVKEAHLCEDTTDITFLLPKLADIPVWTPIAYANKYSTNTTTVSAQLDNTISVAVLLQAISDGIPGTYLFTTEEEIGNSRYWINHHIMTNEMTTKMTEKTPHKKEWSRLFVLDTSPYPPGTNETDQAHLILRERDSYTDFDPDLTWEIASVANSLQIPFVYKNRYVDQYNRSRSWDHPLWYGSTELWAFLTRTPSNIQATTIQIPTIWYHTAHESTLIENIDLYYGLVKWIA